MTFVDLLNIGLIVAGLTHFGVLLAGIQAPKQLNWNEDFKQLTSFNRKIFKVYYTFTGITIVMFGSVALFLREEIINKDPEASLFAVAVGLYWVARIIVDMFVFDHDEWPQGKKYVIGHMVLTAGFVGMAGVMLTSGIRGLL